MVDTHAHLGVCDQPDSELVAAARKAGVNRILTVGMDEQSNREAISAADAHEEVFACVGCHPNQATGFADTDAELIEEMTGRPGVVAVGETGLDFYRDRAPREDQRRAFAAQIGIARRSGLPLVIHMRESTEETFRILADEAGGVTVLLHCFSASDRVAEAAERGWHCSFAGNVTYPSAERLRDAATQVRDELLLVETDSPFLAPQPVRGKPNQPANVVATAAALAELRGADYGSVERTVEENAARLFGW